MMLNRMTLLMAALLLSLAALATATDEKAQIGFECNVHKCVFRLIVPQQYTAFVNVTKYEKLVNSIREKITTLRAIEDEVLTGEGSFNATIEGMIGDARDEIEGVSFNATELHCTASELRDTVQADVNKTDTIMKCMADVVAKKTAAKACWSTTTTSPSRSTSVTTDNSTEYTSWPPASDSRISESPYTDAPDYSGGTSADTESPNSPSSRAETDSPATANPSHSSDTIDAENPGSVPTVLPDNSPSTSSKQPETTTTNNTSKDEPSGEQIGILEL